MRDTMTYQGDFPLPCNKSANIHRAFLLTNLGQIDESDVLSNACLHPLAEAGMSAELSECLHNLGVNASFRGQYERAMELLEEAIRLGRDSNHIIWPTYLLWLGHVYFLLGEYEQGLMSLNKCYELFEKQGNSWGSAFALSKMGLAADGLGEHQQAMHYNRQALAIFERTGNQAGKGYSLSRMSMSACLLEEYAQAMQLGQEGYQIFAELGHRWGMCASLCRLGFASLGLGEITRAREFFLDALQQSRHDHMLPLSLYALIGLACVQSCEGDGKRALELYRYVQRHSQTPTPYLQMAARWMGDEDQVRLPEQASQASAEEALEPIDQIIERLVN
jgi:tetratricopeptide (TPR) repeat protein